MCALALDTKIVLYYLRFLTIIYKMFCKARTVQIFTAIFRKPD
jgi:hypothetical protein